MELPQVGENCSESSCNQLDFLPLICGCGKKYCSDHFSEHAINCSSIQNQNKGQQPDTSKVYMCSFPDCLKTSLVPIICERCLQNFCITHRHLASCEEKDLAVINAEKKKFEIPIQQFKEAKAEVDKKIAEKLSLAKKKKRNVPMANQLQLMLLKNKAVGQNAIPESERVYFTVTGPEKFNSRACPVFISKQWTVGRAIDYLADMLNLFNRNRSLTEPQLRLFKKETGIIITPDPSCTIESLLISNSIFNGDDLILEIVLDGCLQIDI